MPGSAGWTPVGPSSHRIAGCGDASARSVAPIGADRFADRHAVRASSVPAARAPACRAITCAVAIRRGGAPIGTCSRPLSARIGGWRGAASRVMTAGR